MKSSVLNLSFFWTEISSWIFFVHGTRLHKDVSVHIAIVHWASGLFLLAETSHPGTGWESCSPHVNDLWVHLPAVGFNWKASASAARRRVCYSKAQRKETSSTQVYRCLFSTFLDKDKDVTFGFSLLESHSSFKFKISALLRIVDIRGKHYCLCGYQSCKWLGQRSLTFLQLTDDFICSGNIVIFLTQCPTPYGTTHWQTKRVEVVWDTNIHAYVCVCMHTCKHMDVYCMYGERCSMYKYKDT